MPVLLAISRQIAAVGSSDLSRCRGDVLAVLQQARLIAFVNKRPILIPAERRISSV